MKKDAAAARETDQITMGTDEAAIVTARIKSKATHVPHGVRRNSAGNRFGLVLV